MNDFEQYLQPTEFLDFHKKRVRQKAFEIINVSRSEKEKITALFYWVRDEIKYNMYTYYPKIRANLKASVTLRRKNGFCMSKAVLLSTFARAVGIPARIRMVDIINHKISQKVIDLMGTNVFHCHGISEVYINDKWIKLTPVFDKNTALKAGFVPLIEFDGEHDALFAAHDNEGNPFVEYVKDYGTYADVPIDEIDEIFTKKYPIWYSNPQLSFK
ncbi:MAG: transglutaminase domain-containing protein [Promethearchaeota archaeon]|nr:MAG: transglutaminase domain-containing protein [Candidatus Lokiarchaeota archaeon]